MIGIDCGLIMFVLTFICTVPLLHVYEYPLINRVNICNVGTGVHMFISAGVRLFDAHVAFITLNVELGE